MSDGWGSNWSTEPKIEPEPIPSVIGFDVSYDEDKTVLSVIRDGGVVRIFNLARMMLKIEKEGAWPIDIEVMQVGDLAVHKDIGNDTKWMVTHIPTQARFDKALPGYNGLTEEKLIEWCAKVQCDLFEDWALLRTLTKLTYDHDADEILNCKERILNWCRDIKID